MMSGKHISLSKCGQTILNAFVHLTNTTYVSNSIFVRKTLPFSRSIAFTTAQISKLTNEHKPLSVNMQSLGLIMSFLSLFLVIKN